MLARVRRPVLAPPTDLRPMLATAAPLPRGGPGWAYELVAMFFVGVALFTFLNLLCFLGANAGGTAVGVYPLPLSGLFMSVIYPTINSKGISCFPKTQHGAVAALSAKATVKPTKEFHTARHTLFSVAENHELDKVVPISASVKTKLGRGGSDDE